MVKTAAYNSPTKTQEKRIASIEKQIRHLFTLMRATIDNQSTLNSVLNGPTDVQITYAHEWRCKREQTKPPRQSVYGAVYYRPNDIDEILAEYLISQQP